MAKSDAVWTIDIGQCSMKALRCRIGETPDQVVAEAFDFIAYPKILSQPGADPVELIQEALKQFLSRNSVKGDRVAISVPGQNGLARFIKLPPVEAKKIPDIVKYEAKQQIPFDLADVVWDYQRMGGGSEAEGFILETEVGLFAMKRDQVFRSLEPFKTAGIEVDIVQLTPLALYNYVLFDQLDNLPPVEEYMPDDPPPSVVILSLGTDATDLVITNGFRVWQRSIPLGGNHFTKALTKDLKLTFAQAEHIKCNAAKAKDPKRLFQAMRPVFSDLLTEIQRSIGYYTSIDRYAKLKKMVGLGNTMKMPGLRRYLEQSLDMEVVRVDQFNHLAGSEVLSNSTFRHNAPSFGVCYGLAVQALNAGQGTLRTNLLPREIVKERFIREKKPWTAACLAVILLGCMVGYTGHSLALQSVAESKFKTAEGQADMVAMESQGLKSDEETVRVEFENIDKIGQHLIGNVDNRVLWLELFHAINGCLPRNEGERPPVEEYYKRNELMIESVESQKIVDLNAWYQAVKGSFDEEIKKKLENRAGAADGTGVAYPAAASDGSMPAEGSKPTGSLGDGISGPTGPGWIIQLTGHHYHNPPAGTDITKITDVNQSAAYVVNTLIKNLREHKVRLPVTQKGLKDEQGNEIKEQEISLKELGIGYPVLIGEPEQIFDDPITDPASLVDTATAPATDRPSGGWTRPVMAATRPSLGRQKTVPMRRFDFKVQFIWIPTPPGVRLEKQEAAKKAAAAAAENTGGGV